MTIICRYSYVITLLYANLVLHGDVEKERLVGNITALEPPPTRIYTVKVKQIFRGLERIKNVTVDHNTSYVEIHTSSNDGSCGITLQLKESYVVSGKIKRIIIIINIIIIMGSTVS
jgi:hypothetical protein